MRQFHLVGSRSNIAAVALFAALVLLPAARTAQASTNSVYNNGNDTFEFFDANNWNPAGIPGANNDVFFQNFSAATPITINGSIGNPSNNSVTVTGFRDSLKGINGTDSGRVDWTVTNAFNVATANAATTAIGGLNVSAASMLVTGPGTLRLNDISYTATSTINLGDGTSEPFFVGNGDFSAPTINVTKANIGLKDSTFTTAQFTADSNSTLSLESDTIKLTDGLNAGATGSQLILPASTADTLEIDSGNIQVAGGTSLSTQHFLILNSATSPTFDPAYYIANGTYDPSKATFYTDTFSYQGGGLVLESGHFAVANSQIAMAVNGPFGTSLELESGMGLSTDADLALEIGTININGGELEAGAIDFGSNQAQALFYEHGILGTNSALEFGGASSLQSATLNDGDDIIVRNTLTIDSGTTLALNGGLLYANAIAGAGQVTFDPTTGGTLEVPNGAIHVGASGTIPSNTTLNNAVVNVGGLTVDSGNSIIVAQANVTATGTIDVGGNMTINNASSDVEADTIKVESGGVMTITGQPSTVVFHSLLNNGNLNISTGGTMSFSPTPGATVTNAGTLKVTGTTVIWGATVENQGAFISDPASDIFGDLINDSTGYMTGGAGDLFVVNNDYTNHSAQNTLWNTDAATLEFSLGAHDMVSGSSPTGFADNFAWGIVELDSGAQLTIDTDPLFVFDLQLDGGLSQLADITLENGATIYYDVNNPANAYLNGETFALNGGQLVPLAEDATVPEPASAGLLALSVCGILSVRPRRRVALS